MPLLVAALPWSLACGDDTTGSSSTANTEGTSSDTTTEGSTSPETTEGPTSTSTTDDPTTTTDPTTSTTSGGLDGVAFPQAVAGAMFANPGVYPVLPVHVDASGAGEVTVRLDDGAEVPAVDVGGATLVADIDVAGMSGSHTLTATATAEGERIEEAVELVLGTGGVQWTEIDVDGNAGTPRIHRRPGEDQAWITWSSESGGGGRRGWIEPVDGALRSLGDRVQITPDGDNALYARAVPGQTAIAVLYQLPDGGPYFNWIRVVDLDGGELVAPIGLNPDGEFGSFGGDVAYDGAGFVATYRSNTGGGGGDVWWIRIDERSGEVTGPTHVAASGDNDPHGGIDPFSFVSIVAFADGTSVSSFRRDRFIPLLDLSIPKAQVAAVTADGTLVGTDFIGGETDFNWHWEGRVERAGDDALLLWLTDDLNDGQIPIPTAIRGAVVAPDAVIGNIEGGGAILVQSPETRGEPTFAHTAEGFGMLAWTDQRSYVDLENGRIELMARPILDADLRTGDEVLFPHARFIAGTAQLSSAAAGTNGLLVWIDERNGGGIVDPTPEVFFETAWH